MRALMLVMALLGILYIVKDSSPLALAASSPTATATDTATSTATATATPSPSPSPSPTASPTPPPTGPQGTTGFCVGPLGCFDVAAFLGTLATSAVQFLFRGLTSIISGIAGILTGVVRVDQWPELAGFFTFLIRVGQGMAGGLVAIGALRYYRAMLPGGDSADAAAGLVMLLRALECALLLTALPWGIGQVLTGAQAVGDTLNAYTSAGTLLTLLGVFTNPTTALDPVGLVLAVVAFFLTLLLLLVKFASVAILAWLVLLGPLVCATWPLGGGIVRAWFRQLCSVALWGAAWSLWLALTGLVLAGYSVPDLFKPVLVVALLFFGYGIPRAVDSLLQTTIAGVGAAYGAAGGILGVGAMATRTPLTRHLGDLTASAAKKVLL